MQELQEMLEMPSNEMSYKEVRGDIVVCIGRRWGSSVDGPTPMDIGNEEKRDAHLRLSCAPVLGRSDRGICGSTRRTSENNSWAQRNGDKRRAQRKGERGRGMGGKEKGGECQPDGQR